MIPPPLPAVTTQLLKAAPQRALPPAHGRAGPASGRLVQASTADVRRPQVRRQGTRAVRGRTSKERRPRRALAESSLGEVSWKLGVRQRRAELWTLRPGPRAACGPPAQARELAAPGCRPQPRRAPPRAGASAVARSAKGSEPWGSRATRDLLWEGGP